MTDYICNKCGIEKRVLGDINYSRAGVPSCPNLCGGIMVRVA